MSLEELQEENLKLKEENKILKGDNENFTKSLSEKDSRIKSLEEYNQKLFLRATATKKEETNKDDEKYTSKLLGDYANLLNDEELEILKELEEDL